MDFSHVSVLLKECIDWLVTDTDGIYVDCTLGGGDILLKLLPACRKKAG